MKNEDRATVKETARDEMQDVGDYLRELGATLKETVEQKFDELKDNSLEARDRVEDYVREKPVKSLLIAAGAGVLLGYLFRR